MFGIFIKKIGKRHYLEPQVHPNMATEEFPAAPGKNQWALTLIVHPGPSQTPTGGLWGSLGLHLVRVTSPEHTHGRQQDKRLKDWIVELMPVACKKPGSRLQRKMGGRVECPTGLQEKTLLLGKFLEAGFQEIHRTLRHYGTG